ncbi:MAG: nucleotidyltransferase family protein [Woeseiaceae bacterium]
MSEPTVTLPPFNICAAALRKTTEHLARELTQPSNSPPDWSKFEWTIAQAAAAMQGTSVLLANILPWTGPPLWQSFLERQREQSLLRDERVGVLVAKIDDVTRRSQISCVGLKGTALRTFGIYAPGERPMGDIDLLVRAENLDSIDVALQSLGYRQIYTSRRHAVYAPRRMAKPQGFGEHVQNPLPIEVHTAVTESLPVSKIDITNRLQPAPGHPGLNPYPNLAALMLHLVLHTAGAIKARALRQIQIHDIARFSSHLSDDDWGSLLAVPHTDECRWWLFTPLALTARYYPNSIPRDVLESTYAACPALLRFATDRQRLTDVSWSNLRIAAFPGIAWSRTPLELLRLVRGRVIPNRVALSELEQSRRINPQIDSVPWYGLSHSSRIVRWLFSRPPRVQTLYSVRAALESAGTSSD